MLRSFPDALKLARRHIHLHGENWRVLVACKNTAQLRLAWGETVRTLHAGSLPVEQANHSTMTVHTGKGGTFRFRVIDNMNDAHRLAGHQYSQVMWLHEPWDADIKTYVRSLVRSPFIDAEQLVVDDVTL